MKNRSNFCTFFIYLNQIENQRLFIYIEILVFLLSIIFRKTARSTYCAEHVFQTTVSESTVVIQGLKLKVSDSSIRKLRSANLSEPPGVARHCCTLPFNSEEKHSLTVRCWFGVNFPQNHSTAVLSRDDYQIYGSTYCKLKNRQ